jgi:hypothetical protein
MDKMFQLSLYSRLSIHHSMEGCFNASSNSYDFFVLNAIQLSIAVIFF